MWGSRVGRSGRSAALAVAFLLLLPGCWLQVGYDQAHTRYNVLEKGLTKDNVATLAPAWSAPGSAAAGGEPVVANGVVYATVVESGAVKVVAIGLSDGRSRWEQPLATGLTGAMASPVTMIGPNRNLWVSWTGTRDDGSCDQGTVRLAQGNGEVLGTEPQLNLVAPIDAGNADEGPFVLESTYTGACGPTGDARLRVRSRDDLAYQPWSATMPNPSPGVMVPSVGRNAFVLNDGKLKLFTLGWCGSTLCVPYWELMAMPATGAVVADGENQVFVLGGGRLYSVNSNTPEVRWSSSTAGTSLAVAGDVVYTVGREASGRMVLQTWPRLGCGIPVCANTSRTVLGTSTTVPTAVNPVVAGGVVYTVGGDGAVRALDISACTSTSCTPQLLGTTQATSGPITALTVASGHLMVTTPTSIEAFAPAAP